MKTLILKELKLLNFKGIRNLKINFNQITNISGENATGKTTIFDAFTWLLFGKDSSDRKQFEIKTLDPQNRVIPKIDHQVTAILEVNGETIEIKKILKEKWIKKRGNLQSEFHGNETLYYWNNVPLQAKEFSVKINYLLQEELFKLITNPKYFNDLKWQDRRNVLIQIAGDVTDEEISRGNEKFIKLITGLKNKTIEENKREISERKKKLNTDLKTIPTRIDEVNRRFPEAIDFAKTRKDLAKLEKSLEDVENSILDSSRFSNEIQEKRIELQKEIFGYQLKVQNLEFAEEQKFNNIGNKIQNEIVVLKIKKGSKKEELKILKINQKYAINSRNNLVSTTNNLRTDWNSLNAGAIHFEEKEFNCPTCKRAFEVSDVDEKKKILTANFQKEKTEKLERIQRDGKQFAQEIEVLNKTIVFDENLIVSLEAELKELVSKITSLELLKPSENSPFILEDVFKNHDEYHQLKVKLTELKSKITGNPKVENSELPQKKADLKDKIWSNKRLLLDEILIKKGNKRIAELEEEERNLAQQISDLELSEFTIESFIKHKIETLESRINSLFKVVKFKLFKYQINGGEVECCEALINGIPFTDLNNAAKINAGLDIIETLCNFHKVSAPIFIDNRESVNRLINLQSQIINLRVSEDKNLKIT